MQSNHGAAVGRGDIDKIENINMLEMPKKVYYVVDIGLIKIY